MVIASHQKHRKISQYPASELHEGSKSMGMHGRVEALLSATIVAILRSLETRQRMRRTWLIGPLSSRSADLMKLYFKACVHIGVSYG